MKSECNLSTEMVARLFPGLNFISVIIFWQVFNHEANVTSHVFRDIRDGDAYRVRLYSVITDIDGNEMRSEVVEVSYQPSNHLGSYH